MWIAFLVAALLVLVGGIGGSIVVKQDLGSVPASVAPLLPLIENLGVSAGIGLALLGVALLYRKVSRIDAVMGGRTLSSRLRRTRIIARAQGEGGRPGDDSGGSGELSPPPSESEGTRKMPNVGRT